MGSGRGYPLQGTYHETQSRAPPRPGMFPASASPVPFKPLNPGETMSSTASTAMRRPTAGATMGMGSRPVQQRQNPASAMSIGAGIDDAGYPTMPTVPVVHHAAHMQGPQQTYRAVPGMGRSVSVDHASISGQQGIVHRMEQLSVTEDQQGNPSSSRQSHERNHQHPHLRAPPSSHTSQQPSRSHSVGGASISSTASASTARTAGSSTGSSLNLHQHYVDGQAFAPNDRRPMHLATQQQQPSPRASSGAASSQHGHNGNSGNGAAGGGENPLLDLLSSEREYVDRLMSIVRKLDDLGANPSTPKALGDLLVQWVEDLIGPYTRYASIYLAGYDHFPSAADNQKLPGILGAISRALPPFPPMESWTLDALFRLPYIRLRYYRRLYGKLLASATEGRSDYNLLKVAGEKLNTVINTVEERLEMDVNQVEAHGEDTVFNRVRQRRAVSAATQQDRHAGDVTTSMHVQGVHKSPSPSFDRGASKLEEERRSVAKWEQQKKGDGSSIDHRSDRQPGTSANSTEFEVKPTSSSSRTTITPIERPENSPLTDLEIRLDTAKAVDLFTMQLKACRLQIAPSTLTFSRHLRRATDTVIRFNPTSTKRQVVHKRAHIFVLSDLFLMCEHMSVTEKAEKAKEVWVNNPSRVGDGGPLPEMWLLYPPLAGRHLSVLSGGVETELIVTVMKRETFLLTFDNRQSREDTLKAIQDCIDFASSVPRAGTSRSTTNSPRIDGSMINESRQTDRKYIQQEAAQNGTHHQGELGGNFSRIAHGLATPPIRSTSHSPQPMQGHPPAGYCNLPTHQSHTLYPPQHSHNGESLPRTASAPIPETRYYADDAASRATAVRHAEPTYQTQAAMLPSMQPLRSHSAEVYGVNGRNGSITAEQNHTPSTRTPHHMRQTINEPDSPVDDIQQRQAGPAVVAARLKCKVFLKGGHEQWRPLGPARLQLYIQQGTNIKQLVVEADTREKTMLISTIVLTDGVERVAKTGVAVEISDGQGKRAGLVYMLKCEDEESAGELFSRLISGSDRARSLSVSRK
ncbi:hypothetical protein QFC22_002621 [Naganishia vaughanmartiniae]|uniref:Uncharacterized protein n=1 Tax=Naganishia vaughanmartiniae TaxID=1424756 RepID=A0ACC2XBA9_9TREE|nr:hypothetical protein QFC22_002621 [Naganishia vaughanmartiniae]